jgi:hypothetical protein
MVNYARWPEPGTENVLDDSSSTNASIDNGMKLTTPRKIYQSWCESLMAYNRCGLTKESDILVALVGIADEVGHAMSDCLVAGLWKAQFVEDMCWHSGEESRRPIFWRAPGWSRASRIGTIVTAMVIGNGKYSSHYGLPSNMAELIELYTSTMASGEVKYGSALLEGRLIPASLCYIKTLYGDSWCVLEKNCVSYIREVLNDRDEDPGLYGFFEVNFDIQGAPCYHVYEAVDVQLLLLLRYDPTDDPMIR